MPLPKSFTTVTPFSNALAMAIFILFPILAFFLGMAYQESVVNLKILQLEEKLVNLSRQPTPTPDETINWKTYANNTYNFSIRYPNSLKFCLNDFCINNVEDNLLQHVKLSKGEYAEFYLIPLNNLTGMTVKQIGRRAYKCTSTTHLVSNLNEDGVFLGLPSYEFDMQNGFCDEGYLISQKDNMHVMINGDGREGWTIKEKYHAIFVQNAGIIYRITYPKTAEFEQILSTFKFLPASPQGGDQTPSPTCIPRPACLDATPRCLMPESENMCPPKPTGQTACTQEAKLCPDGSYVGRTGPNCEFTKCPQ